MRRSILLLLLAISAAAALAYYGTGDGPRLRTTVDSGPPEPAAAALQHARVQDAAGILKPFESKLARMADAFDTDLGIDVHVVTTTDPADSIDEQAERVFRERGIGVRAPTGGLLLLLNSRLQRARIEVGYTLEGGLTDLQVGEIARNQLTPYAANGIAGMAVMDVLHYLRDLTYVAAARDQITLGEEYGKAPRIDEYRRFYSGGAGTRTALAASAGDVDFKERIPEPRRSRYAPDETPEESLDAYLRATAELAGDPSLELFTEGSRLMRASYPFARFEEEQRFDRIRRSQPLTVQTQGDFAVASSKRPVTGFVPILLRRDAVDPQRRNPPVRLWRVDAVETWKNLFFGPDGNYFLQNSNTPYRFGLAAFGEGQDTDIAPLDLKGRRAADAIAALGERDDVLSSLLRGEIWFRNAFVPLQAFAAYNDANAVAPGDTLVLETIGRRAMYLELPDLAIPALKQLKHGAAWLLMRAYNQSGDLEAALAWAQRGLDQNPYDTDGLAWKEYLEQQLGRKDDARQTAAELASLLAEKTQPGRPVVLAFNPAVPTFHAETTLNVDGTTVYDHSKFAVTMRNTSNRPVAIESVKLFSEGNDRASGLGDVVRYWRFPSGGRRLEAGESVTFEKTWGFVKDTSHVHLRYVFITCWRGDGSPMRQCRTQHVDVMPAGFPREISWEAN